MTLASGLDQELVAELKDIMGADFDTLVQTFLQDSRKRMDALQQALESANAEAVREQAHSMKGSSSNLGAALLSELCRQLEMLGRENNLAEGPVLLERIRSEFAVVEAALE